MNNPLISVCCITYNHENFIKECIRGFLSQDVNFDVEFLIHDDASTDKTQEIIRDLVGEDPRFNLFLRKENITSKGKAVYPILFKKARGKYIAQCEGDDYWIDPYKLQKQANFLENNLDFGLIFTDFNMLHEKSGKILHSMFKNFPSVYTKDIEVKKFLIRAGYLAPCTWMFRKDIFFREIAKEIFVKTDGSFSLALEFMSKSKLAFISETTSVYRILQESASHSSNLLLKINRAKGIYQTQIHYAKRLNFLREDYKEIEMNYVRNILVSAILIGDRKTIILIKSKLVNIVNFSLYYRILILGSNFKLFITLLSFVKNCKHSISEKFI